MTRLIGKPKDIGNRLLDPLLEDFFAVPSVIDRRQEYFVPRANIAETEESLVFTFEVPGMNKDDIKVMVSDRVLTVSGKRELHNNVKEGRTIREEIRTGQFERQFSLPDSVRTDSIKADYKNGILVISLDKKDEVKPREIEVKIS